MARDDSEDNWKSHIISGNGTLDDPFVLDGTDNEAQRFLDKQGDMILGDNIEDKSRSNSLILLNGSAHYGCSNGALWEYVSGGPSASNQDMVKMLYVDYMSYDTTVALREVLDTPDNTKNQIKSIFTDNWLSVGLWSKLASLLGKTLTAKALAIVSGAGLVITVGSWLIEFGSNQFRDTVITAANAGKGLISCNFASAYQGYWLYSKTTDVWNTYPTAYEPISITGYGSFSTGSRI